MYVSFPLHVRLYTLIIGLNFVFSIIQQVYIVILYKETVLLA